MFTWIIRRENYILVNWKTTIKLKENMHFIHVNRRSHIMRSIMQFIYISQRFKPCTFKTALMTPFANGIQYSALGLGWESLPRGTDLKVFFLTLIVPKQAVRYLSRLWLVWQSELVLILLLMSKTKRDGSRQDSL